MKVELNEAVIGLAYDAHHSEPSFQVTLALHEVVKCDLKKPSPARDEDKSGFKMSTLRAAILQYCALEVDCFATHPVLGPAYSGLIKEQLEITPLPISEETGKPIEITSRIALVAIRRAVVRVLGKAPVTIHNLGTNEFDLNLRLRGGIDRALKVLANRALFDFFDYRKCAMRSHTQTKALYDELYATKLNIDEKSDKIRKWIGENQGKVCEITSIDLLDEYRIVIPDELALFRNIRCLRLTGYGLRYIPESICDLSQLVELNLQENRLESIPDSIRKLSNLSTFILNKNRLSAVPSVLGDLPNLDTLDLTGNEKISEIITTPSSFPSLKYLSIEEIAIQSVPEELRNRLVLLNNELA